MDGGIIAGLLFFWIICGVIGAIIADNRGGNSAGGFCLGVLFGPIGILIACFIGSSQPVQVAPAPSSTPQKRCPDCAELVQRDARICRYCRHEFATAPEALVERPPVAVPEPPPVPVQTYEPPSGFLAEPDRDEVNWELVLGFVAIAALIIIVVVALVSASHNNPDPTSNGIENVQTNMTLSNSVLPGGDRRHRRRHR